MSYSNLCPEKYFVESDTSVLCKLTLVIDREEREIM